MSAYIVSHNHINVLASYFASRVHGDGLWTQMNGEWQHITPENAGQLAQILYSENVRSVNGQYRETSTDEDYSFQFIHQASMVYTPAEIGQAIAGLEYQSCETDDYFNTQAYAILGHMRKHLLSKMADREDVDTWSIDEVKSPFAKAI